MDLSVIPECYVDTNLIETLVPPVKQYNHQKGCGTVTKVMKEKFADSFALGIIDKDKKEVDYLKEFDVISSKGNLILHKHKKLHHYLIQVTPAMEQFMITNATAVNIDLKTYELSSEMKELKKAAKSTTSKDDKRFKKLFKDILAAGADDFVRLQKWIKYLKENSYKADSKELAKI